MKRAFLFPGQGAQYGGMGKDLAERFPAARAVYERASARLGFDIGRACFEGTDDDLVRTDLQQPAILVHSIATLEALKTDHGDAFATPDAVAGLSLGEYTALVVADVLTLEDGAYLVRKRGEFMQEACDAYPSTLAAVLKLDAKTVAEVCERAAGETGEHCVLGNILGATNVTISGGKKAVARAIELAKERRARAIELPVAGAFHSPYMKSAEEKLAREIANTPMQPPRCPVVCNVDAQPTTDVTQIRENLLHQLTSSVLWADSMRHLLDVGVREFVEIGPGRALTNTLKREIRDVELALTAYGTVADIAVS